MKQENSKSTYRMLWSNLSSLVKIAFEGSLIRANIFFSSSDEFYNIRPEKILMQKY